jgi:VWFA-related protein
VRVIATLAALALAAHAAAQTAATVSTQPFRTGTELVLVDVAVLDSRGVPVPNLTAADFRLSVGGRPRPIQSVQFIRTEPAAASPSPRDLVSSTNQLPSSGRLVLIVVDEWNLRLGAAAGVLRAAEGVLGRLSPGDLVGLSRIPDGGGVEFTTDRTRIIEDLKRITGRPPRAKLSSVTVYISEAADYEDTQRMQWPAALKRECGEPTSPAYGPCAAAMQSEAHAILREEEQKRSVFASTLSNLLKSAGAAGAPVTMVLISQSLFLGRDPGVLWGLAATASAARVSLHVVRPAISSYDIGSAGFSSDPSQDEQLRRHGLETLAAQFRGAFHEVSSTGASAFEQIGLELSGYYLLGVEPTDEDRTGRARRLQVEVIKPGLKVRARPTFSLPMPGRDTTRLDAAARLRLLVSSPVPTGDLPMRIAAASVTDTGPDRVRVLIAVEIGAGIDRPAPYHVGLITLNNLGVVVTQTAGTVPLTPARAGRSPALFTTSLELGPGEYAIRLAAIDPQGRAGSVHHNVTAALKTWPGRYQTSDLIVAPPPPEGRFPQFNASSIVDGGDVAAILEIAHPDMSELEQVTVRFEVSAEAGGEALVSADGNISVNPRRRSFSKVLGLSALPAADYFARAIVSRGGQRVAAIVTPFRLEPRTTEDPFDATVVRRFIEALERRAPVSPSLQSFVENAKAGRYESAPDADSRSPADLAMVTFVGGVSALRDGKPVLARALLTQTLKAAPDFDGAALYLALIR